MGARAEISGWLGKWLTLTQAEGVAIESGAWKDLREIQWAKSELQPLIADAASLIEREAQYNPAIRIQKEAIHVEVKRLISLETRNQDLLAAQRNRLQGERGVLEKARRNLQKVRHSYAGRRETAWEQYS